MCGIAGIVAKNARKYDLNIAEMLKSIEHRGPDENGAYSYDNCVLGHVRLSIIDLETGQQPMLSYNKLNCITLNGEIYGYQKIRERLKDYPFKTTSDTEVILALYEKFKNNLPQNLPGMFSFAIWDEPNNELFCARDRFGEKPFYYAIGKNNEFIFASEIKAIIATGLINPIIDKNSVGNYLKRLYVHPTKTIYQNIFTLPPAHYLIYKSGKVTIEKYWKLPEINNRIKFNEAVEQFKVLFENSIKNQLIADVPVAAFLSGGLDSSTIVAVASKYVPKLTTFTFSFGDTINETPYAKQIAERYNTEHIELFADDYNLSDLLVKMQTVFDEPFADSSNIPTYLISEMARKHVKVVLTGEGGDELMSGYSFWYKDLWKIQNTKKLNLIECYYYKLIQKILKSQSIGDKINGYYNYKSINQLHFNQNIFYHDAAINKLMLNPVYMQTNDFDFKISNTVSDAMNMDILDYMPGDVLVKSDRVSLAHALELRCPFLDKELAEFCISLPANFKISDNEDKVLLRRAYENQWSEEIRKRSKQGFGAPVKQWLEKEEIKKLKNEFLFDKNKKLYSIVNFDFAKDFFDKNNYNTWILLVLSIWMENHEFEI